MALDNKGNSGAYTEAYYAQYESTLSTFIVLVEGREKQVIKTI